ncbi:MAG: magnesium chelatase [Desulfobacterales bacterium]|nr:magnesium chelatase [Desulfobacteraceae bacterium]MBT4363429.1 magnesium chelatase [Desulfobacteraceae bacterium]MBT7087072.1 magnesium chelatase [Desulfobacterales bacterium]
MSVKKAETLGELKKQFSSLPDVRTEMRTNLIKKLQNREPLFPGIIGYNDSVIPSVVNAILCGHNIVFLGERGQGKSRLIRSIADLLDDEIPAIENCPIHDDPFKPICTECKKKLKELGDDLPVTYIPKEIRLVEKLATSDVSTADLIGEVDPIKIARGKTLDDDEAIHFGLVPRANRGIFAINELPDLAEKIQVAFFNIMEENDFQIKGFPVRLPLDILIVATANPEDYTNRGRIITPLKDRFDVQIRTHYPIEKKDEIKIMNQEVRKPNLNGYDSDVPDFIKEIIAETTFQARSSSEINQNSGVSCRVSIRSFEAIMGNALKRCLDLGEKEIVPRISDIESTYPAITGKLEMEYDILDTNGSEIIENLVKHAVKAVFDGYFNVDELSTLVESFQNGMSAEISQLQPSENYMDGLKIIPGMENAVAKIADISSPPLVASAIEFILEGLHLSNKLNREIKGSGLIYK